MMTQKQVRKTKEGISFGLKVLLGILFISPLIIGFLFSIQYEDELTSSPLRLFTANPTLINYIEVFQKVPLLSYLKNSLIVCVLAITIQIVVASLAAYGFSFFEFKGKQFLFGLVLASMMIPGEVVVITNFVTVQNLGLTNTYLGLIITSLVGGTTIFMMRQYFLTLSKDFKEAATLDGCGDIGFLFRIALPLSLPTLSSLAVYLFVSIYNAYFWPLLVTTKSTMRTVQVGVAQLVAGDVVDYSQILASAMIAIIPTVVAYIFGQDYIIKGMTAGGVKG